MNFITEKKDVLFDIFLDDYSKLFDIDKSKAKSLLKSGELFARLTDEWYEKIRVNQLNEAYRVYDDEYYFVDIFNCYATYSREYIKRIKKSSAYDMLNECKTLVDIGCGISYSTCALKQLFPHLEAYAINLRNTKQWSFCEQMSERFDFRLIESVHEIGKQTDIVFASEYFEHIENPTKHFQEIVDSILPKYFVIANAFNTHSIGHYETYKYDTRLIDQSKISKMFNDYIKESGYENVDCKIWNSKPTIWRRKNANQPKASSLYCI